MDTQEGNAALAWRAAEALAGPACVFVDRDGVINERPGDGWVLRWSDFRWRPDARVALATLRDARLPVVVVSNQSCVGRGLLTSEGLERIMAEMTTSLARAETPLAAWYCCPHAPDAGCDCRKPKPGMLRRCARECGYDLTRSFMIGDTSGDIEAGNAAGCASILIDSSPDAFAMAARAAAARASTPRP